MYRPVTRPEGDSLARYGNNLLPVDWRPAVKTSPVFNYPYARTREALDALSRGGDPDPYHGHKLRYVNPASGESAMPTIGTFIQLLPRGFAGLPVPFDRRARCYVCVEGAGENPGSETRCCAGAARHLCRAGLDEPHASRRRRRRAVQLFRPPGPGETRSVARGARQCVIKNSAATDIDRFTSRASEGSAEADRVREPAIPAAAAIRADVLVEAIA